MTHRIRTPLSLLALAALLAACSTPVPLDQPAPVETRQPPAVAAPAAPGATTAPGGATATGTPQSQVSTVELERQRAAEAAAKLAASLPRTMYFDFDSFVLRAEYRPAVEGYAKLLTGQPARKLGLEGHADERGGREYNLALGQKRAEAVARALELLGVNRAQLEAVSFGEEKPADPGHDEAAWAKNRRVELKDR